MGWDGSGNFIRDNGANTGANTWEQDRDAGTKILAPYHDVHDEGIATGLENCVTRDGQNSPSQNLPMNTKRHTNVGAGVALTDYARVDQVQNSSFIYGGTSTGAANTYTLTLPVSPTTNIAGLRLVFLSHQANTTAATLTAGGISGASIKRYDGSSLAAGDIPNAVMVEVVSDGTNFRLHGISSLGTMSRQNASAVAITGGTIAGASINTSSATITGGSISGASINTSSATITGGTASLTSATIASTLTMLGAPSYPNVFTYANVRTIDPAAGGSAYEQTIGNMLCTIAADMRALGIWKP